MAGRMDRYVAKTVAGSYFACLLFLVLLFALIDLLLHLGGFMDKADERGVGGFELAMLLARYYTVMVPFTVVTIAPFVTVIAGMFSITRLMGANEVVPMLFSGRGMLRVLRPVLATGVLTALAMAVFQEFVVPPLAGPLAELRHELESGGRGDGAIDDMPPIKRRGDVRQTLFCDRYYPELRKIEGVVMLDAGSAEGDEVVVRAAAATWHPERADWELTGGERATATTVRDLAWLGMEGLTPDALHAAATEVQLAGELGYSDLLELIELRPGVARYRLAFHSHLTFPLANLVLLLLALPLAVHFERGRRIERVVFAILLCAAYLIFDLTCRNMGEVRMLHPVFAAWLPTIVFGSFGVVFFTGMRS